MSFKVSIIIPIYNAKDTIAKCLDSIFANGFLDFEIILINDGSSDDSWKIMQEYMQKFPNVVKIFDQENQGVAKTRNSGMERASGEYLMFIDNDDYVESEYLETYMAKIKEEKADAVFGGYKRTTGKKVLFEMKLRDTPWSKYMIMAPWAKIYRKDFLLGSKIEFLDNNIGEDVYFNLQVINSTDKITVIDYCGYNWFYNEKSISNSKQKNIRNKMNVMRLLDSSYEKLKEMRAAERKEVEFYFTRYIIWYLLFAGRRSSFEDLSSEFVKTFAWLENNFPQFRGNKNISLFCPKGEALKNRIAVFSFMFMYKMGIIKTFLRLYSA